MSLILNLITRTAITQKSALRRDSSDPETSSHSVVALQTLIGKLARVSPTMVTMGFDLQPGSLVARSAQLFQLHK
eukprot:52402-Pelagomonas_calceolata.AAC.1